ncbi:protein translocase subunit SecD [candidate division LCP-89 bacterium B3_LCP]|uniref:Protein translocase subunit SecD n=1 Tax=candidate division LCP-89 bacterium B3_LCP TaxID=2012998 RepID=A0A532UUC7_UNCL8|nr:MAG: protein translocase subunit SecD [candidate division LCP-89 bacterium B3_LCP]
MKKRNTAFRLGMTIFFILIALYYLYPTYRYNKLEENQDLEVQALAELTGAPAIDLQRAVVEGRGNDVMNLVAAAEDLEEAQLTVANEKARYLIGEFADKLDKDRKRSLKLGLDLQGGMRLVLEVNLVELMSQLAKNRDAQFDTLLVDVSQRLKDPTADFDQTVLTAFEESKVRLSRYFLETQASNRQILDYLKEEADDAITRSLEIMYNRVDQFGVSEPSITRQGKRRIVVALPGVQDPARARDLIGKTALLEFKLLSEPEIAQGILESIDEFLRQEKGLISEKDTLDTATADTVVTESETEEVEPAPVAKDQVVDAADLFGTETDLTTLGEDASLVVAEGIMDEHPFYALLRNVGEGIAVISQNRRAVDIILARPDIREIIPQDVEFLWSNDTMQGPDGKEYWNLYVVNSQEEMTGTYLTKAEVEIGSGGSPGTEGQAIVSLAMNRKGARIFSRVTGANVGRKLAIVLDKHVYMAPVIKVKIPDGRAIIEGSDSMEEARDLAIVLRAGALPAPVDFIEERTVGPSLGADSIAKGKFSALLAFALVALFMLIYYRFAGILADFALILNILFLMAILAGFQGTLTMPGIAGIILTIGMAVDANVLIYERIREELRTGKTVRASIDAGYARATVTVLDANITTIIAAVVLFQFGTGPIKGFALTLMIGIVASLYTALIGTRLLFDLYTQKFAPKKLSI